MTQWLKHDLKPYALETLTPEKMSRHGLFNHATVATILDEHFSGKEIHDTLIWSLLILRPDNSFSNALGGTHDTGRIDRLVGTD